jgi:hypothetical protein
VSETDANTHGTRVQDTKTAECCLPLDLAAYKTSYDAANHPFSRL